MNRDQRSAAFWQKEARGYDAMMAVAERRFFVGAREWVCSRAVGEVLEVGVGTGLNLPLYPPEVQLTGMDRSGAMLAIARQRAASLGRKVALMEGDAMTLDFPDSTFDTVVSTFTLCCVPDERHGLQECVRVLRPGGRLLLADHVVATNPLLKVGEYLLQAVTVPLQGEWFTRRPLPMVRDLGLEIVETERTLHGAIERVHARRPD